MRKLAVSFAALIGMASAALAQPVALSDQQLDVVTAGWGSTFQLNFNSTSQRTTAVAVSGANVAVIPILSATAQGNATAVSSNQTVQVNHN
jgi:hypothetical protein